MMLAVITLVEVLLTVMMLTTNTMMEVVMVVKGLCYLLRLVAEREPALVGEGLQPTCSYARQGHKPVPR